MNGLSLIGQSKLEMLTTNTSHTAGTFSIYDDSSVSIDFCSNATLKVLNLEAGKITSSILKYIMNKLAGIETFKICNCSIRFTQEVIDDPAAVYEELRAQCTSGKLKSASVYIKVPLLRLAYPE
jgi:hypothetical protein